MRYNLKRFSESQQDQVEQLIEYAHLLGLTGKDLVSIGGKLDREQSKSKKEANMVIVKGFECLTIGRDYKNQLDNRFKLKTINGSYNFQFGSWNDWTITSLKTKVKRSVMIDPYEYELPKTHWTTRSRYALLLDIANGKINLNF